MILLTRISLAKKGTKSLKTTVPEGVAEFLELFDKDELDWKMEVMNNERIAVVKKRQSIKPRLRNVKADLREQDVRRRSIDLISNQGNEASQRISRITQKSREVST